MKVGDKIRFLDAIGGGIVKGFQGKDLVIVEDQDGFDVPVLIRDCVVIEPANEVQVRQSVKTYEPQSNTQIVKEVIPVSVEETKEGEQITVCLAYLPIDIKTLNTTGYECYLVNDSNYYLSYSYMNRTEEGWVSRAAGLIEPNTKVFLDEFEKEDLNDLEKVSLQFISYKKDKPFALKNPCSVELRLDTVKFYKLHSFRENDYFDDNAIIYYVMRKDLPEKELIVYAEDLEQAMKEKKQSGRPRIETIKKEKINSILEIDLHIDELLDTTAGLSAADMLEYQLAKVREVMESYKSQKGQKIVFIHGKGNGVLKKTVLDELKSKYKNAYTQDASFREYGFGATMVTIR